MDQLDNIKIDINILIYAATKIKNKLEKIGYTSFNFYNKTIEAYNNYILENNQLDDLLIYKNKILSVIIFLKKKYKKEIKKNMSVDQEIISLKNIINQKDIEITKLKNNENLLINKLINKQAIKIIELTEIIKLKDNQDLLINQVINKQALIIMELNEKINKNG